MGTIKSVWASKATAPKILASEEKNYAERRRKMDDLQSLAIQFAQLEVAADFQLTTDMVNLKSQKNTEHYPELYLLLHAHKIRDLNERTLSAVRQICLENAPINQVVHEFLHGFSLHDDYTPTQYMERKLKKNLKDIIADYQTEDGFPTPEKDMTFIGLVTLRLAEAVIKIGLKSDSFDLVEKYICDSLLNLTKKTLISIHQGAKADEPFKQAVAGAKILPFIKRGLDLTEAALHMQLEFTQMQALTIDPTSSEAPSSYALLSVMSTYAQNTLKMIDSSKNRGLTHAACEYLAWVTVNELSQLPESQKADFESPAFNEMVAVAGFMMQSYNQDQQSAADMGDTSTLPIIKYLTQQTMDIAYMIYTQSQKQEPHTQLSNHMRGPKIG